MKKLLLPLFVISTLTSYAQSQEKCGFDAMHQRMLQEDAKYRQATLDFDAQAHLVNKSSMAPPYRIPTVVHVMHKGEPLGTGTNISDDDVKSGIRYLNERLRKTAGGVGDGGGVDTQIEYALAVRDPSGNCTNGIVRYDMSSQTAYMNCGVDAGGGCGISDAGLKALSRWSPTDYYNIYLVWEIDNNNCGAGIQGYAYFASSHGNSIDGSVMLACTFGGSSGTTLTHEIGHSLNLYHTFEGDGGGGFCPPVTNGCGSGQGDCCGDIPRHARSSSNCNVFSNTCDGGSSSELFIHNYLDYSSDGCQDEFTANQSTRMQAAVTGTRASFLESNGNMSLVPPAAPVADFQATGSVVCTGSTIKFIDNSTCVPNTFENDPWTGMTFSWSFDNGVDPVINSSLQNPTITFTNNGQYDVTYTVTTAQGTSSITKNDFIVVSGAPGAGSCSPGIQNVGYFGYAISNVSFNDISNSTGSVENGNQDYTCTYSTVVYRDSTYDLSIDIEALGSQDEYYAVYIDFNNNGTLNDAGETVFSGTLPPSTGTTTRSTTVTIPSTATQFNSLRMRVISDQFNLAGPCDNLFTGESEDYTVYVGTPPSALSIEEIDFEAQKVGNQGHLNWTISASSRIERFVVERNTGNGFRAIGTVEVNHNVEPTNTFTYQDNSPELGTNQYRIKVIGVSASKLSLIRELNFDATVEIAPNPFKDQLSFLNVKEKSTLHIYDVSGQIVFHGNLGVGNTTIDLNSIPNGTYFIRVVSPLEVTTKQLIKVN